MRCDDKNLYYAMENDKVWIYDFENNKWVYDINSIDFFKLPFEIDLTNEIICLQVKKMFNLNDHSVIKPPLWLLNCQINKNKSAKFNFDFLMKFNAVFVKNNCMNLEESTDCKSWKTTSYLSQCYLKNGNHNQDLLYGINITDTYPIIFFNSYHKKYIYYNRCNIGIGCRYISYSTSDNRVNWTKNKCIKTNPSFNYERRNNYYMPSMINYDNYILNLSNFINFKKNEVEFRFMISDDIENFKHISTYKKQKLIFENGFHYAHNFDHIVPNSMFFHKDKMNFFVLNHSHKKNYRHLKLLSLRKDGFTSLYSNNGFIKFKIKIVNNLIVNFNGNLKIYINNEIYDLKGNHINHKIIIPNGIYNIKIEFNMGYLYSLSGYLIKSENDKKLYTGIKYVYIEYTDFINDRFRDKTSNNCFKTKIFDKKIKKIISDVEYENFKSFITLQFEDNSIEKILLEDTTGKNEFDKIKKINLPFNKTGTYYFIENFELI